MDGDSLHYTLLTNITEGGKETKETKINSVSTETDSTGDENSEKETTEESEKELVDTTAAKKTAKRRKKLKPRKRDISEEEFVRGDIVRWTLSTHRDKKEIKEKEVAKREHKRLSEVGRRRSEALMMSQNMQWKKKCWCKVRTTTPSLEIEVHKSFNGIGTSAAKNNESRKWRSRSCRIWEWEFGKWSVRFHGYKTTTWSTDQITEKYKELLHIISIQFKTKVTKKAGNLERWLDYTSD